MARAWQWASLLLCLLQLAPGRPHLAPPQNVTLFSRDFRVYLTWLPGPATPQNVNYSVMYRRILDTRKWHNVEWCTNIKVLDCDMTCLESADMYDKFKARVLAVSASSRSHWVESEFLEYFFEVEPAPPVLLVTQTAEFLNISATYLLPSCMELTDLYYELVFWKEGTENKTLFPFRDSPVWIPLQPHDKGNYCLSARTRYSSSDYKYSSFSSPTCLLLKDQGPNWVFLLLLLLPPTLPVVTAGCVLWKNFTENPWSKRAKMPQILDFSGHRPTVASLSPSSLESLDILIVCPQKELSTRTKLSARGRSPVGMQAQIENSCANRAEDEEEEVTDEDEDNDNVSFRPYIAPPTLPGHSESRGPGTPPLPADKAPDWDSSSSSWARTESSGYLSKEGSGQRLGKESPGPLLLPEVSEDSDSLEEPLGNDSVSWINLDSLLSGWTLHPGEPPVCLHTLSIRSNSSIGVDDGEEEEESGVDSESEDCGAGSWWTESPQETEARGRTLGHYMAR